MNLPGTPPVPMTEKCVECGGEIPQGQPSLLCGYCLGSVCPKCAQGHDERLNHPDTPEEV